MKIWNGTEYVGTEPSTVEGSSAYEVAVENGFVGTEADWLESLEGVDAPDIQFYIWTTFNLS